MTPKVTNLTPHICTVLEDYGTDGGGFVFKT